MRLLLIHQNFPGQFRRMAPLWAKYPHWDVLGLGRKRSQGMSDIKWVGYDLHREPDPSKQHPYLVSMESAVLHGQATARALLQLKQKGYTPDTILAHPGWGETLYARDVFPNARLIHLCEWYYGTANSDFGFDPEFSSSFDAQARVKTWNALHALNLVNCDAGISATQWQRSRHPKELQHKIQVIHEGVDTHYLKPDAHAELILPNGTRLRAGDPIVTYVARNLEPYRGFHIFMRALVQLQREHPTCHVVIVGGDEVSYGSLPKDAANWREKMLSEVKLDMSRVHILGKLPYATYAKVLQVSAAHVYLTYPFVLSWSMLEAMASACVMIASRTAPVEEVITDGVQGVLTDFFDSEQLVKHVVHALNRPESYRAMRAAARAKVQADYTLDKAEKSFKGLILGDAKP